MSNVPSPKTLIAVVSLGAVLGAAVVDFGRTAPGELLAAHGRLEGLADSGSCSTCHGGWTTTMAQSCLECHELIGIHIEQDIGLHGTLSDDAAGQCQVCHSEHHGTTFRAVNDLSFARAGVEDRLEFDHDLIGWLMDGKHLELECAECHEFVDEAVVPEGKHRYLGVTQTCVTCHEDEHDGAFRTTCVECHVQTSFEDHVYHDHDQFLDLVGGHAEINCRECHGEETEYSLEAHRGPEAGRPEPRTCTSCHDLPHKRSFVLKAARAAGVQRPAQLVGHGANRLCGDCHQPEHLTFGDDAESMTAKQHAASNFLLDNPHGDVGCAECHDPALDYGERYPGRDQDSCAKCHEDIHKGQFAGLEFEAFASFPGGEVDEGSCLVCHARTHFDPNLFDAAAHEDTDLPLEGSHVEAECSVCHLVDENGVRVFHGLDHRCETCHDDAHEGFFDIKLAKNPPVPFHGECARCHDANGFSPVDPETFDHEFWTRYPLVGAHAATECTTCHQPTDEPDATGRTLGRVADVFGEVNGCYSCHDDVHEAIFDREGLAKEVSGRKDCARCHSPMSFRDLPWGFDHGGWTGWSLDHSHAEQECSACHEPMRRPDEHGRTWGRAEGRECSSCHLDDNPHGTQFTDAPRPRDCSKCHQNAREFKATVFSHTLDSRFPLDGAHTEVACAGCHKPDEETGIPIYRPLGMECVDCHGVHESALRRRKRR